VENALAFYLSFENRAGLQDGPQRASILGTNWQTAILTSNRINPIFLERTSRFEFN